MKASPSLLSLAGVSLALGVGFLGCAGLNDPSPMEGPSIVGSSIAITPSSVGAAGVSNVPFVRESSFFAPGDLIVIREVLATSVRMGPGDTVLVRGDYQLSSRPNAVLALQVTTHRSGPTRISPTQRIAVTAGSGEFELSCQVNENGALHVSFYPTGSGKDFGGVYFGPTL